MRRLPAAAFTLVATLAACGYAEPDPGVDDELADADEVVIQERRILNGLGPDEFWNPVSANPYAMWRLRSWSLQTTGSDPYFASQVADPWARKFLSKLIACALPYGERWTVRVPATGATYRFSGFFGLAPGWQRAAISAPERRLVSACTIATVNAEGALVFIDLRGEPARLFPTTSAERSAYPIEEASFYGDVFTPDVDYWNMVEMTQNQRQERGAPPAQLFPDLHACWDAAYVGGRDYIIGRTCGFETCVAVPVGACEQVCAILDGPEVVGDHDNDRCLGAGRRHEEVVTAFLHDSCALVSNGNLCTYVP